MMFLLRMALVVVLTAIGVAGFILPILPGWLFILLAVLVAFPRSSAAERILVIAEPKMPRVVRWLRRNGLGIGHPRDFSVQDTPRAE